MKKDLYVLIDDLRTKQATDKIVRFPEPDFHHVFRTADDALNGMADIKSQVKVLFLDNDLADHLEGHEIFNRLYPDNTKKSGLPSLVVIVSDNPPAREKMASKCLSMGYKQLTSRVFELR